VGLIDIFRRPRVEVVEREQAALGLSDWAAMFESFVFNGQNYTLPHATQEDIGHQFASLGRGAYKANGIVFAVMAVRMNLFAEARFMYRRTRGGRPGDLFDFRDSDLAVLRKPWPGATTVDLLTRMIQHADLAGNAFVARRSGKLAVLRPDWVTIVGGVRGDEDASVWHPDAEVLGYAYEEGGPGSGRPVMMFDVSEVAHFAPNPDPEARFRGMSWLTPIVREVMADKAATDHKLSFFENGATPNMLVKMDVDDLNKFKRVVQEFREQHEGADNAYKTLFLAAGADATIVGSDLKQLDFKVTQGAGETRIAAAGGTPPVIVGLSEGLEAATYSNYELAMRRFADLTMSKLWRDVTGSLAQIIVVPSDAELAIDPRDIPALREDMKKAAEIREADARTIRTLVDGGFSAESVVAAVDGDDMSLLEHTGLLSVQLQDPTAAPPEPGIQPAPSGAGLNSKRIDARQVVEDLLASLPSQEG